MSHRDGCTPFAIRIGRLKGRRRKTSNVSGRPRPRDLFYATLAADQKLVNDHRLGRSLQDLIGFLSDLQGAGRDLYLHQQTIDTTTPSGRAMFQMLGVFAEFERAMIRERVNAGLARAKAKGVKLRIEARIRDLRDGGMGILKIARHLNIGTSCSGLSLPDGTPAGPIPPWPRFV
jgi:hypothetical protein